MADISKIKVSNTTYTVKDSTARGSISSMQTKLDGIQAGAEVNVQSDWNVTDTTSDAYIKNKPSIPQGTVTSVGLQAGSGSNLSVSGSPITSSGTMAISVASGYSIPSTERQNLWNSKQDAIVSLVGNDANFVSFSGYVAVHDDGDECEDAPRPANAIDPNWDPDLFIYSTGLTVYDANDSNQYRQYSFPSNSGTLATLGDIAGMTQITWAALKQLRDSGGLTPGMQYRITDFVTTVVNDTEARSANHQFDVIVTANAADTLSEEARATAHDGDTYFASNSLQSNVHVYYTLNDDEEIEYVGDGHREDVIMEGDVVNGTPRLYKTDYQDYPDEVDYEDWFDYEGVFTFDGAVYDKWVKCEQGEQTGYHILTNRIIENGDFTIEIEVSESKLPGDKCQAWKIWYSLDNDPSKSPWVDVVNGKGVIYRMIDEYGNDMPYDFKNIQFKRYLVTDDDVDAVNKHSGNYVGAYASSPYPSTCTLDMSDYKWLYTFSTSLDDISDASMVGRAENNKCNHLAITFVAGANGNCVFLGDTNSNTFDTLPETSTFYNASYNNVLGTIKRSYFAQFSGNVILGTMEIVDALAFNNNQSRKNSEITYCQMSEFAKNVIGFRFISNKFLYTCQENEFLCTMSGNTFGGNFSFNMIKGPGVGQDIGFRNNRFSDEGISNIICLSGDMSSNNFYYPFNGNYINVEDFKYNSFSGYMQYNKINVVTFSNNSFSARCDNNDITSKYFMRNVAEKAFTYNTFKNGESVADNKYYDFEYNNIIGNFKNNSFNGDNYDALCYRSYFYHVSFLTIKKYMEYSRLINVDRFETNAMIKYCSFSGCHYVKIVSSSGSGTLKNVTTSGYISGSENDIITIAAIPNVDYVQEFTLAGKTITEIS